MTSVLGRLASARGRRDEVPNQELARELAGAKNRAGIREIAEGLKSADKRVQADCVKVLYEIGYVEPKLIAPYAADFVALLRSRNNRLVWGGMIALSTVAALEAKSLYAERAAIQRAFENGSVITRDNGVKTLARIAAASGPYRRALLPYLLDYLRTCRHRDVPQHAEHTAVAVNSAYRAEFVKVLESRAVGMPASRLRRIKRVIKSVL
jgi:hypothetical protein